MDWLGRNLALARKDSRASRQYRCLDNHAVLSLLWHAEFRFRSLIYFNSPLYSRHTKLPGRKCFRRRLRRRRQRPASGAACAGHGHVRGGEKLLCLEVLARQLVSISASLLPFKKACYLRSSSRTLATRDLWDWNKVRTLLHIITYYYISTYSTH